MVPALTDSTSTLGLLFGSFNPPHLAHVKTAEKLKRAGGLTEVWMLPVPASTFKKSTPQAGFDEKLEMCAILAEPHSDWLKTSDACRNFPTGLVRQLQHYKRTLETIFNENADRKVMVLSGSDFSQRFQTAVNIMAYFGMLGDMVKNSSLAHLQVLNTYASRVIRAYDVLRGVEMLSTERSEIEIAAPGAPEPAITPISSERIRKALEMGSPHIPGLPPELHRYINNHGLYRSLT